MSEQPTQKHQRSKTPTSLEVSMLSGVQVMAAGRAGLQPVFLHNKESIEKMEVCTLTNLSMEATNPLGAILPRWSHVQDVIVAHWKSETADPLLGCDLPEARHCEAGSRRSSGAKLNANTIGIDTISSLEKSLLVNYITAGLQSGGTVQPTTRSGIS